MGLGENARFRHVVQAADAVGLEGILPAQVGRAIQVHVVQHRLTANFHGLLLNLLRPARIAVKAHYVTAGDVPAAALDIPEIRLSVPGERARRAFVETDRATHELYPHRFPDRGRGFFPAVGEIGIGLRFSHVAQHTPDRIAQQHTHGIEAVVTAAGVPESCVGDLADIAGIDDPGFHLLLRPEPDLFRDLPDHAVLLADVAEGVADFQSDAVRVFR